MSHEPAIPLRLRLLFDAICEGDASAAQVAELESILRSDESARRLYRQYCRLHVDLHFVVRGRRVLGAVGEAIHQESRSPILGFLGDVAEQGTEFRLHDADESARPAGEFAARFAMTAYAATGNPFL